MVYCIMFYMNERLNMGNRDKKKESKGRPKKDKLPK